MNRWILLAFALAACGSTGKASPSPVPSSAGNAPAPMTPSKENVVSESFEDGPMPVPSPEAISWMKAAGKKRLRIPAVVTRGGFGPTATLGGGEGATSLSLDTGALSRTLDDHLADHCGAESPCTVWLEGTWGPLVGASLGNDKTFAVRKVVGKVDDLAKATLKVQAN